MANFPTSVVGKLLDSAVGQCPSTHCAIGSAISVQKAGSYTQAHPLPDMAPYDFSIFSLLKCSLKSKEKQLQ
jgi:hypothetical protein